MQPSPPRIARRRGSALLIAGVLCTALGLFYFVVGVLSNQFFDALNRDIAPPSATAEERAIYTFERVSRWEYFDATRVSHPMLRWLSRMEHASPLHVSARTSLTAGADQIGPCGSVSRSMIVLLRRAGVPARKAQLYTDDGLGMHTVVEVAIDGEWRVFDPTYAWVWRRPSDGGIATAADLRNDAALFASVRSRHPEYPLDQYHYRNVYHLRWEKLPGLPWVRAALERLFGKEWVQSVGTPYLYERPNFLTGFVLWGAALVLLAGARFRARPPQADRPARRPHAAARSAHS